MSLNSSSWNNTLEEFVSYSIFSAYENDDTCGRIMKSRSTISFDETQRRLVGIGYADGFFGSH